MPVWSRLNEREIFLRAIEIYGFLSILLQIEAILHEIFEVDSKYANEVSLRIVKVGASVEAVLLD
jgi:hypothetical protein